MCNFIPLGSIVLLKGGVQKLIIISRSVNVKNGENTYYFEYGAVPYPMGLISDQVAYFHGDSIGKVIFEGYSDYENESIIQGFNEYLETNPNILRGDAKTWGNE